MIKAINRYFFDSDKISLHDALWFYGMVAFMFGGLAMIIKIGGF